MKNGIEESLFDAAKQMGFKPFYHGLDDEIWFEIKNLEGRDWHFVIMETETGFCVLAKTAVADYDKDEVMKQLAVINKDKTFFRNKKRVMRVFLSRKGRALCVVGFFAESTRKPVSATACIEVIEAVQRVIRTQYPACLMRVEATV